MNKATWLFLLVSVALASGGCVVAPYDYAPSYYDAYRPYPYSPYRPYYYRAPYVEVVPAWPVYRPYSYPHRWRRGPVPHHRPWRRW